MMMIEIFEFDSGQAAQLMSPGAILHKHYNYILSIIHHHQCTVRDLRQPQSQHNYACELYKPDTFVRQGAENSTIIVC